MLATQTPSHPVQMQSLSWRARAKSFALATFLACCWASVRYSLNYPYSEADWEALYHLSAPLPFGKRILVPLLARPFVETGFLSITQAFLLWEAFSAITLFSVLKRLFGLFTSRREAIALSYAYFFFLSFIFLMPSSWPLFYPYDLPSILFTALFIGVVRNQKWTMALLITVLASINRETAIFFGPIATSMHIGKIRLQRLLLVGVGFSLTAVAISFLVSQTLELRGAPLQFAKADGALRILLNAGWLGTGQNFFVLLAYLGYLPLTFFLVRNYIPVQLRSLGIPGLALFLGLTLVGNINEPRIFGELSLLLYVPAALGTRNWLINILPANDNISHHALLYHRVAPLLLFLGWAGAAYFLIVS